MSEDYEGSGLDEFRRWIGDDIPKILKLGDPNPPKVTIDQIVKELTTTNPIETLRQLEKGITPKVELDLLGNKPSEFMQDVQKMRDQLERRRKADEAAGRIKS